MFCIYIIGYYDNNNIGDEQYKLTLTYLFKNYLTSDDMSFKDYNIKFMCINKLNTIELDKNDILILGGGDVLNDYFISILKKISPFKIYAISTGIPYLSILNTYDLCIFDKIFIRTKQDIPNKLLINEHILNKFVYVPDASIFLLDLINPTEVIISENKKINKNTCIPFINTRSSTKLENLYQTLSIIKNEDDIKHIIDKLTTYDNNIIGLFLSQCIYNINNIIEYENFINEFTDFLFKKMKKNDILIFIPMGTKINSNENDIIINNNIIEKIIQRNNNYFSIINIEKTLSIHELFMIITKLNRCISMRYHACLFSIYNKIPFFPIYTTRKIKNLLLDNNYNYGYKLQVDNLDFPINFKSENIELLYDNFCSNDNNIKILLNSIIENLQKDKINYKIIQNILLKKNFILNSHNIIKNNYYDDIIELLKKNINEFLINKNIPVSIELLHTYNFPDDIKNTIVQLVSYYLTGTLNSKYNYGLKSKLFTSNFNFSEEFKWLMNDNRNTYVNIPSYSDGIFNLSYIDQNDYSNSHRSGWQYVYENIKKYNNENADILLDIYVDRTFHWNNDANEFLGIIPYKKNWIGFIHHTFENKYGENNCYNLIKNKNFIESLKYCKGLILLSKDLQNKFNIHLPSITTSKISTYHLTHPTLLNEEQRCVQQLRVLNEPNLQNIVPFSYKDFLNNKNKQLVHIGGWLRNIYSFYGLVIPNYLIGSLSISMKKTIIVNNDMGNYIPSDNFLNDFNIFLESESTSNSKIIIKGSSDDITNFWYKFMYQDVINNINSVTKLSKLSNQDYDLLLSQNLVFINLIDASAVNTLIECVARNTPIIINNHPAVIEILGSNYPLYFNSTDNYVNISIQLINILNIRNIKKAYLYLLNMNKSNLSINTFTNKLNNIITNLM